MKKNTTKKKGKDAAALKHKSGNVREEIIEIVSNLSKIPKDKIEKYNSENFSELGMDSFALIEIIYAIENAFDINIPQDSLAKVKNIDDLVELITQLTKKNV